MEIKLSLNTKSIDKAIKQLEQEKLVLENLMFENFLDRCYEWFIKRANYYLGLTQMSRQLIDDIQLSWVYNISKKGKIRTVTVTNSHEKATFIEFGVGIVGEENAHQNAGNAGYEYNKPTPYKRAGRYHDENTWRFVQNPEDDVDLVEGYYEEYVMRNGKVKIITRGSPSIMYAFNALVDLRAEMPKMWETIKKEYWS